MTTPPETTPAPSVSTNAETAARLRWQKFPVLDDGFVCLVDVMGDDGRRRASCTRELRRRNQEGLR